MKKLFFLIGSLLSSWVINAQIMGQSDIALLLAQEKNNGTARFNAIGAFGALGGDMSAGDINPAGLAVFKNSRVSGTLGLTNADLGASFTGNKEVFKSNSLSANQLGAVLVFDTGFSDKKYALGFNYSVVNNYDKAYKVTGNSGVSNIQIVEFNPVFNLQDDPFLNSDSDNNNNIYYTNVDGQSFQNTIVGANRKYTFSFATQQSEELFLGASIVTYNVDVNQETLFEHASNDGNGNTFDSSYKQNLRTFGSGAALTLGAIYKPTHETRLGFSYQTPTFYNLTDEFKNDLQIKLSNRTGVLNEVSDLSASEYDLVTPSRLTGSFAYILGKEGFLSFDYTYKNYTGVKLRPANDFNEANKNFRETLKGTSKFNVGAEWRIDKISLRGGYMYEQSLFKEAKDSDNIQQYSLGLGFKLGKKSKLDLAYQKATNTGFYNFANGEVESVELDFDTSKFTATLIFSL